MRWMLIAVLLFSCDGSKYDGCADPCPGAFTTGVQYFCDGGPCPVGEAVAEPYFVCLCTNGHVLTFREPDQADCAAARSNWQSFYSANCR